jgi:hypothetical protein
MQPSLQQDDKLLTGDIVSCPRRQLSSTDVKTVLIQAMIGP